MKKARTLATGTQSLVHLGNGDTYQGPLVGGKPHGMGTYTWKNQDTYTGMFQNGLPHGFGVRRSANGSVYSGDWKAGARCGLGNHVYASSQTGVSEIYMGRFENNTYHGYGIFRFKSGNIYSGYWSGGKMHGKGSFQWPDGSMFNGTWKQGQRDGLIYYSPATASYTMRQVFKEGVLVEEAKVSRISDRYLHGFVPDHVQGPQTTEVKEHVKKNQREDTDTDTDSDEDDDVDDANDVDDDTDHKVSLKDSDKNPPEEQVYHNKEQEAFSQCVVCTTQERNRYLRPCGHVAVCDHCVVYLIKCPICRITIIEDLPAYIC
jgi:hypothetical protein